MALPLMQNSGRGTLKHFYKLAEKKPELKRIMENITEMSVEEVEKAKLPKWVRKLIIKEKEKADRKAAGFLEPTSIADIMSGHHVDVGVAVWSVYKLTAPIKIGVKFQVEAEEGDIVALTDKSVLVNSINKEVTESQIVAILGNSIKVGDMSPEDYREQVRSHIDGKY